jgi:hypothetical protein
MITNPVYSNDFNRGKDAEKRFAKYLLNITWATAEQDIKEHWDIEGVLPILGDTPFKFDVKGLKKINRFDNDFQNDSTWIEGTNVRGDKGWIKGNANYIVFERASGWLVIDRELLYRWVLRKLRENGVKQGKGLYKIYTRFGRQDKLTLINFNDLDIEYITIT